jgi:hypothetical protein
MVGLSLDRVAKWVADRCARPFDLAAGPVEPTTTSSARS